MAGSRSVKKRRRNPFKDPSPYGTYEGEAGNPEQWRQDFQARLRPADIKRLLGADSPWVILGIAVGSSPDVVKAAWRRLALKLHPDRGGDQEQFLRIQAAYERLTPGK